MAEAKLKAGDPAPEFDLLADDGSRVKLSDLHGKKIVLYFYRKDDTPGCTRQSCGLRDNYAAIQEKNAIVLGVSPDDQQSHQAFKTKFDLPFPLLVDEGHKVAEAYGVWGEGRNIRSHFVIDENGKLADVQFQVTPEDSVASAVASVT
jgi:peroxiredoxin Q/BCP